MHQQTVFLAIGKAETLLSRAEISVKESSRLTADHGCADCLEEHNRSRDPQALPQPEDIRCWQRSGGNNAKVPCLCFATSIQRVGLLHAPLQCSDRVHADYLPQLLEVRRDEPL